MDTKIIAEDFVGEVAIVTGAASGISRTTSNLCPLR